MTIKREDLTPSTQTDEDREAERKALDDARQAEREAQIAKAKAEGELEALRKLQAQPSSTAAQATISEEQWKSMEEESGLTRQQIIASSKLTTGIVGPMIASLKDELKKANDRAESAEREVSKDRTSRGVERTKEQFFKDKPAYSAYRKEVDEFLEMFPEADRSDPAKMKAILGKAETFVKGLAGGKMRTQSEGNQSSVRLGGGSAGGNDSQTEEELDLTGLETKGQRLFVAELHEEFRSDPENAKVLDRYKTSDGLGVAYDGADEFKAADAEMRKRRGVSA